LDLSQIQSSAKFPGALGEEVLQAARNPGQTGKEAPGMNRRTAMMLSMLLGGLAPLELWAQTRPRRTSSSGRSKSLTPTGSKNPDADALDRDERERASTADDPPAGFAHESGFQWHSYDIARYTRVAQSQQNPQKAIIEWIFRRTGTADWHGDKIAVLCASKTQLRAYNSPEILKQVGEIVERFTNATEDILKIHVRFFVASDTRWRHTIFSQLTPWAAVRRDSKSGPCA
jgi:hypothetical protein